MRAWGRLGEDPRICASAIPMVYQSVEYSRDSAAIRAKVWPGLYRSLRIAGTKNGVCSDFTDCGELQIRFRHILPAAYLLSL